MGNPLGRPYRLMMKKARSRHRHRHAVLIARFDDDVITYGAAGLGDICHAASGGAVDAVAEGEKRIRTERNAVQLVKPFPFFNGR